MVDRTIEVLSLTKHIIKTWDVRAFRKDCIMFFRIKCKNGESSSKYKLCTGL